MSLERGEKTLGINNWKFNQCGFKGECACGEGVCVAVGLQDVSQDKLGFK